MIIFLPVEGGGETDIGRGDYEVWVVPGAVAWIVWTGIAAG